MASEERVALEPFAHQVGGHSGVMLLDRHRVCKPAVSQELQFYRQLPDDIRRFAPEFYGIVSVRLEEDSRGLSQLVAYPGKEFSCRIRRRSNRPDSCLRVRLRSGRVEAYIPPTGTRRFGGQCGCGVNPWSLRCFSRMVKEMSTSSCPDQTHEFIVLENMAERFRFPCVLDVKMGTRQHGDDASHEKRLRQEAKCAASTSHLLGLRLCGMQVFQVDSQCFICYDKYLGRRLQSQAELSEHLSRFLDNGLCRRGDVIKPLVKRLGQLRAVLQAQCAFRFYSSSLLLIYEGDPGCVSHDKTCEADDKMFSSVDVRLIDFAHTTFSRMAEVSFDPTSAAHYGPDKGFLLGLDNLINLLRGLEDPTSLE